MFFLEEAQVCRSLSASLCGRPEELFLIRLACAFEELASEGVALKRSSHAKASKPLISVE
jgi:hypothetical protein